MLNSYHYYYYYCCYDYDDCYPSLSLLFYIREWFPFFRWTWLHCGASLIWSVPRRDYSEWSKLFTLLTLYPTPPDTLLLLCAPMDCSKTPNSAVPPQGGHLGFFVDHGFHSTFLLISYLENEGHNRLILPVIMNFLPPLRSLAVYGLCTLSTCFRWFISSLFSPQSVIVRSPNQDIVSNILSGW